MIFFEGAVFTISVGLLVQYLCGRFGVSGKFAALLPVNGSIWERLKLIFWPMLIFSAVEYFDYGMYFENFAAAKAASICIAAVWSVALSFIYDALWQKRSYAANACIFVLASATGWTANYLLIKNYCLYTLFDKTIGTILVLSLMICFMLFSFAPPKKKLFIENA